MLRALWIALVVCALPDGFAAAAESSKLGENAALKYWQAFAQLPKLTDDEAAKLHAECLTKPLDANARELATKAEYALRMMRRGAAIAPCDWGVSYEDGIDVLLPHLQASRNLESLACLRARLAFEDGQPSEAVQDLLAAMALGRHASLDGSLIAVLVGYAIEHRTIEALAMHLPKIDHAELARLDQRLASLPAGGTPSAALLNCEQGTMQWLIDRVKATKDDRALLAVLGELCGERGDGDEKRGHRGQTLFDEAGGAQGIIKFAEQSRQSYVELANAFAVPVDQFPEKYESEVKKQANNPVFKLLFPAITKVRVAQSRVEVSRAQLRAAIAVQLADREALKTHLDPVTGGEFEYLPLADGFQLLSKYTGSDNKPVKLIVGTQKK